MEGRILVVDDTEAKRYFIVKTLRQTGMEVLEATSGQEALEAALLLPDVVLLDVRLPDMSGFEVCRRLKADADTAVIPVLYISSMMRDEELEVRLFEDGADGYIPQPIEPKHLVAQTWALMRMRRAERQRQHERAEARSAQERTMRELDAQQRLLEAVLRQMPMGICLSEAPSGRSLLTNERFDTLLGHASLPGLESFRAQATLHPDGRPYLQEELPLWRALYEGTEAEADLLQRHDDGSSRLLHAHAVPVRDMRGALVAGVLTMEDITEREAIQESLRVGEERLRLALESAALGVWSYEPTANVLTWDARVRELFGLSEDEPVSMGLWLERIHPEDRARVEGRARAAAAGEHDGALEVEFRATGLRDGGVLRWLSARGRGQRSQRGGWRLMGTLLDITQRKQAERYAMALQATTAAFAHSLTARQVADALVQHGLETMNASAGAVFTVGADAALGLFNALGYPEATVKAYQGVSLSGLLPLREAVRTGQPVWVESPADLYRGGEERVPPRESGHRSWLCMPMKGAERMEWVLGLSFTTLRRFSPQEQEHLESLCVLGAQALARARLFEEAQRRSELEQQFLGMVSHDLRNPLQAISLGARTLQRLERPSPEALLRMTGRIATSADTMGRMVSDLLDFTRGRLGGGIPLERTAGDLMRVVREVLDEFSLTHPSSDVVLEGEAVCEGWWDGPRMRQVLSNLLSNALRHAREGTAVKVRVRAQGAEVELSVENQGEPIPEGLLPVLFEPFRRGSATFRPAGSLGLGLYIVNQVVEGHGGHMRVESGGTRTLFTAWLPRRAGESASR